MDLPFPDINVGIYRSRLADIPRQVVDGEMHVGFVKEPPPFKELTSVPVHADEMVLVATAASRTSRSWSKRMSAWRSCRT